jgi:hypothetical protein
MDNAVEVAEVPLIERHSNSEELTSSSDNENSPIDFRHEQLRPRCLQDLPAEIILLILEHLDREISLVLRKAWEGQA